jgi:hypothetical protein
MNKIIYGMGIVIALAAVGCGGDDDEGGVGGGKEGMLNTTVAKQSATSNVTASTTLVGSADPSAGETAANSFYANALSAQGAVSPSFSASLSKIISGGMAEGTCECTGTTCNFVDCSNGGEGGSLTINGSLDWTGGNVVADLEYVIEQTGQQTSTTEINVSTDLTVTATEITGSSGSSGSIETSAAGQSVTYSWANEIDYVAVTLANGQPNGGSVEFAGSYTIQGMKYSNSGTIAYP